MNLLHTFITVSALCLSQSLMAFDGTGSVTSGSLTRAFSFHSPGPASPANNLPLLIMMHGDGGNGAAIKAYCGMDAVADAQNFIVVYPDAISSTWNRYVDNVPGDAGLGNANAPDDVLFISDMINYFCTTYHINPSKVYAGGHSAGGFMAYNLGIQLTGKIAAIAPVAASLWGDNTYINNYFSSSYTPIPVYHIHGDADGTVSYPDPNNVADAWGEWPLSGFGNANCSNNTYIATTDIVAGSVKKLTFCNTGKQVSLIRIMGGGHGWPTVSGYNAAAEIWNFCKSYSITTTQACSVATGVNETNTNTLLTFFPNPSQGTFSINSSSPVKTLKIYDVLGKDVGYSKLADGTYSITNHTQGVLFVEVFSETNERYTQRLLIN